MDKVALVTGASRGIGKACALRLAECGYDIVVNYNSNEALAQEVVSAIEAMGRKAAAIKANTADLKEVQAMFREAHKLFLASVPTRRTSQVKSLNGKKSMQPRMR